MESPKILAVNPTGAAKCFSSMQETSISSTEILLLNIQELLKVAADNARQQERQLSYEKGTFWSSAFWFNLNKIQKYFFGMCRLQYHTLKVNLINELHLV